MSRVIAFFVAVVLASGLAGTPPAVAQAIQAKPAPKKEPTGIDTASAEDLQALKGIGDVHARKIIDNRLYKGKAELVPKNVIPRATDNTIRGQLVAERPAGRK